MHDSRNKWQHANMYGKMVFWTSVFGFKTTLASKNVIALQTTWLHMQCWHLISFFLLHPAAGLNSHPSWWRLLYKLGQLLPWNRGWCRILSSTAARCLLLCCSLLLKTSCGSGYGPLCLNLLSNLLVGLHNFNSSRIVLKTYLYSLLPTTYRYVWSESY